MTFSVEIADPRSEPEPHGWTEFRLRRGLPAVWDYALLTLEAWPARNPPLLLVVRHGSRIVAGVSVLVCRPPLRPRFAPPPGSRSLLPQWVEVSQPWLSGFPGVVFADELDDDARAAAVRTVERALVRRVGPLLAGVLYRAVDERTAGVLRGRARLVRQVDTVSVLPVDFRDADEWMSSLSKARRKSLRRALRNVDEHVEAGRLRVTVGPARDDVCGHEVATLVERHRTERGVSVLDSRSALPGSYFHDFVRRTDVHTLTYHDSEGRLLALNTWLEHPHGLVKQHWAARSPADGGLRDLLFDSYLRAVRHVIARGIPEVSAGRSPHEVKRSLGFVPRPVYGVAVPRPVLGR
ncbi:hypothetical protein [Saccharomonospora sp. NB11]|uniref:hypothetical protein n=1 Tax=Saccharomonospora sp. NB11 TaxID=1642298 RepID=UPI0018D0EE2A|nr:hypothetical protein [Saccharomonospora sp. NB11]